LDTVDDDRRGVMARAAQEALGRHFHPHPLVRWHVAGTGAALAFGRS
jgi:hypothetical protein